MDEVNRAKARYTQQIEDGRKIEVFTSTPEWQWYVASVIQPTIDEYTRRIMSGEIESDKEDWIMRGMVMGMKLMIENPANFKETAKVAKKQAKDLAKYQRMMDDERND